MAALVLVAGFIHPAASAAPTLRAAAETLMTLLALSAAALIREQFRRAPRRRTLLLFGAVMVLALSEFVANALPAALHLGPGTGLILVYPFGQLVAAVMLVLAARMPSDGVEMKLRRPIPTMLVAALAACGICALAGWLLRPALLLSGPASQSGIERALHRPLGFAVLLATSLTFVWAGLELVRRARTEHNRVLPLLAAGAILLGAARLYYLALPIISPERISLREGLRLAAFGFIFSAALRREWEVRAQAAHAAVAAERRRMAQNLHDSLAQDLAFIAANESKMAERLGEDHPVTLATRHALAVSRQTISELSGSKSASPRDTLEAIAHELGQRFGMRIVVDVAHDVRLARDVKEHLERITREAIANAARHGQARHVFVTVKQIALATVLRVVDDGHGISEQFRPADEGFGISGMRDRVASAGGTLTLRRAGSRGTELETRFP